MLLKEVVGQQEVKERLLSSYRGGRLAHTQLFLGPEGSGSLPLAIAFAQYVNCASPSQNDSCGVCPSCKKYQKFAHPDLHFYFPTTSTDAVKKEPKSELFLNEWRAYLSKNQGYATQNSWYNFLDVGNKQGTIYVRDAADIISKMTLKAYEARYKVVVIWLAEKLNDQASNKLLKTLEEPPDNTLIMLIGERYELLLATVRSRAQLVKIPPLSDHTVRDWLITRNVEPQKAELVSVQANGNLNKALDLLEHAEEEQSNFMLFRNWLRQCYKPGSYVEIHRTNQELAKLGRERQKSFLRYGLQTIHNALTINHNSGHLVKAAGEELDFTQKFAPFINQANQQQMASLFEEAIYHIERNAHAGILFTDVSFQLVDLIMQGRRVVQKK
jgi:DNA polymerase-3 subunit delta'